MENAKKEFPDYDDLEALEKISNKLCSYGFEDTSDSKTNAMPSFELVSEFMYMSPVTLVVRSGYKDPDKGNDEKGRFVFEERDVDDEIDNQCFFETVEEVLSHAVNLMDQYDEKSYLEMCEANEAETLKRLKQ